MKKMGLAVQEFLTPGRWRVNASCYMVYSKSKFHPVKSIMDGFDFANSAKTYGDAASTITLEIIIQLNYIKLSFNHSNNAVFGI